MNTIYGMPIVVSPLVGKVARFTLSPKVTVTQQFRDEFNEWARRFFGEDDQVIITDGKLHMNSEVYGKLLIESKRSLPCSTEG